MRVEMEKLLKEELRILAIRTRDDLHITQREMSKKLVMSESSYSDIETVEYMCGTLTTVLLFIMQKDPNYYLRELAKKFEELHEQMMQLS